MRLLVVNAGSATLKWKLYRASAAALEVVVSGNEAVSGDPSATVQRVLAGLQEAPQAIAHRIVHGGELAAPVVIDADVAVALAAATRLAPLHNRPALAVHEVTRGLGVPEIAVFDTAFHQTMPERAWRYALPRSLGPALRRYGFHGLSHQYVAERYAALSGHAAPTLVSLHLGGGASACAIRAGRSVDTSMGFTPLEGLVMGTRAGDLDPGVVLELWRQGRSRDEVEDLLHHQAGLAALAGTSDMRALLARQDGDAALAIDIYCDRARKYLGAYLATLAGAAEAVVFTGGIGERAPEIRRRIVAGLGFLGLELEPSRNQAGVGRISSDGSPLAAWVIATDEELVIARAALPLVGVTPPATTV